MAPDRHATDEQDHAGGGSHRPTREDRLRRRRSRLSWSVPVAAVAAVGLGTTAFAVAPALSRASAPRPQTAAQLLTDIAGAQAEPFSGTVVESADLGIPALPGSGSSTSLSSLMSGSHTLRVWSASAAQERVAVIGDLAETDVVHNGADAWIWYSSSNSAEHLLLPAERSAGASPTASPDPTELTPATAAARFLAAVGPTTEVTISGTTAIAGRSAYVLQISPKDTRSLVDHVSVAFDAATFMPLRVQVFSTDGGAPAFSTGFTTFSTGIPDSSIFAFTPPPGATVTTKDLRSKPTAHPTSPARPAADRPVVSGSGWTSVVEIPAADLTGMATGTADVKTGSGRGPGPSGRHRGSASTTSGELSTVLAAATPVSGSFGSGRVLTTRLVSVLILDDGRVFVGAVAPALLEAAASK